MSDTSLNIGNLIIHEPVAVFTDIIISVLCIILIRGLKEQTETCNAWKRFFLFIGLGTLAGGISHAFFAVHSGLAYKSFWLTMQFFNGLSVYAAQQATLSSILSGSPKIKLMKTVILVQLLVFCILVPILQNFLLVVIDCALGLIPVMIFHLKSRDEDDKLIGYGIMVSFLTGIVHGTKLSLHTYFNHNDIAHVLIMISLYLMYKGAKKSRAATL